MKRFIFLTLIVSGPFLAMAEQADHYLQILDQITQIQKELKSLASPGPDVCWDCVLKEKPICSFNDACAMTKPQQARTRLYEKSDGTYIPNFPLLSINDQVNKCRDKLASNLSRLPESQKKFAELYKQKSKKLYELVRSHNEQVAFIDINAAMYDTETQNAEKAILAAEKVSGKNLSAPVRQAWIELLENSYSDLNAWPAEDLHEKESALSQKDLAAHMKRVNHVFADAQERILKVLDNRKTERNAEQIEALKSRIRSIKLRTTVNAADCHGPNAFYDPDSHEFAVCPQVSMLPDNSLFPIVAHELSHSIDPCSSISKIKPSEYPFNDTLKCLSGNDSVNARNGDNKMTIAARLAELKDLRDSGGAGSEQARRLKLEIAELNRENENKSAERCGSSGSQLQEAFSDWMATEAFAEGLPDNETSARKAAFEGTGLFASLGCYQPPPAKLKAAMSECTEMFPEPEDMGPSDNTHPFSSSRVNRIYMVHPKIKNALGCTQQEGKYCE